MIEADAENASRQRNLDAVLLSALMRLAYPQARRLLRRLQPNRMNLFMWLYRDRASLFYSPIGVTENARPILAARVAEMFRVLISGEKLR